jgi:hypothetical protein
VERVRSTAAALAAFPNVTTGAQAGRLIDAITRARTVVDAFVGVATPYITTKAALRRALAPSDDETGAATVRGAQRLDAREEEGGGRSESETGEDDATR